MKKILILSVLFFAAQVLTAEDYSFKANTIKEIEIAVSAGTLNIISAKTKDITISITPDNQENVSRNIRVDTDRDLKIYLDDMSITEETVVNITVPSSKADIEINSAAANVNVSNIKGSLNIEAMVGSVNVSGFVGDLDIDTAEAGVKADGMFKDLDIESAKADVFVTLNKIPSLYEYSVEGSGYITLKVPSNYAKARLKVERKEFYGKLSIQ